MIPSYKSQKRILIVSTVSRQFYLFEQVNIEVLKELGWDIHCVANFSDASSALDNLPITRHHIQFKRSPFSIFNLFALIKLVHLINKLQIDLIHCHTPVGGLLSRVAKIFTNTKLIYTAHGFHFYKGAPLVNWLLFYPVEFLLSKYTNILITINKEDFKLASRFLSKSIIFSPGIGLNIDKFSKEQNQIEKKGFITSLSIPEDAIIFLSVGELIKRKNLESSIIAFSQMKNTNCHYIICGTGVLKSKLINLSKKLCIENRVHFLGFRQDIPLILRNSDVFIFPSFQEGLPVSLMESMASGLPVICSSIRGNVDLITDGAGGYLVSPNDISNFSIAMDTLSNNVKLRQKMGNSNKIAIKEFSHQVVKKIMKEIYSCF